MLSSVHQACPLSPLLSSLYLGPLCLSVSRTEFVSGLKFQYVEVKLLTYADDAALFCTDLNSISGLIEVKKQLCEGTGAGVNWLNICGFFHGNWEYSPAVFEGVRCSRETCKYLGVLLQHYINSKYY